LNSPTIGDIHNSLNNIKNEMTVNTYYIKKIYPTGLALLFISCVVGGLYSIFVINHFWYGMLLLIGSPIFIFGIYEKTKEAIIITDEFIKIKTFKDEEIGNWEWIYEIKSKKYGFPYNVCYTCIYWSKINAQKQQYPSGSGNDSGDQKGKLVISSRFANYERIVAYIVAKKKDIKIDKTTRKIIEKGKLNN
jgi:hypothetical protein